MPIYLFNVNGGEFAVEDLVGCELGSDLHARDHAILAARDMLAHSVLAGRLPLDDVINVLTVDGRSVLDLRFGDAVTRV